MTRRRLLAALAALPLAACGRKGPPVAPERRLPQPVADLTGAIREDTVELTWTNPGRRVDNTRLADLATARVFRAEDVGIGEPKPALVAGHRVAGYTEVATIRVADEPSAPAHGGRVVHVDRGLTLGRRYTYVVVTTDAQGRTSAPSRRLTLTFIAAPEAPREVRAEAGEQSARLNWARPERLSDGGAISGALGYEILRGTTLDGPLTAVTRTAPGETGVVDRGLENDQTYYYAVRAVRTESGTTATGAASARVAVTPADMTPPSPPSNLVAIPSRGSVRLSWSTSPEADVAVYVVYRAAPGAPFTRVGSVRVPGTTFVDRDVPAGTWRYAVTAQDAGARANESARSGEVRVSVP